MWSTVAMDKCKRLLLAAAALVGVLSHGSVALGQDFDYGPLRNNPTPDGVGAIIDEVARVGRGDHHFLLSYCSFAPGVVLPADVRGRNPVEITIVLEWQYWDLEVVDREIRVMVSFNLQAERIVIPLDALTYFSDPTAGFAAWLRPGATSEERCNAPQTVL